MGFSREHLTIASILVASVLFVTLIMEMRTRYKLHELERDTRSLLQEAFVSDTHPQDSQHREQRRQQAREQIRNYLQQQNERPFENNTQSKPHFISPNANMLKLKKLSMRNGEMDAYRSELNNGNMSPPLPFTMSAVTYESCKVGLTHPKKTPIAGSKIKDMVWQHFPKCGSSFSMTLYNHVCTSENQPKSKAARKFEKKHAGRGANQPSLPEKMNPSCWYCGRKILAPKLPYSRWGMISASFNFDEVAHCREGTRVLGDPSAHEPLDQLWLTDESVSERFVFANFREPRERLISAYNYGKQTNHMSPTERKKVLDNSANLEEYVRLNPRIRGCQTKMILGMSCHEDYDVTSSDIVKAKRIISSRFAFVGISSMFNASVCLFHHKFGGELLEREMTFHVRDGTAKYMLSDRVNMSPNLGSSPFAKKDDWQLLTRDDDPADWEIYQYALRIFAADLLRYGLMEEDDITDQTFLESLHDF